LGGAYGDKEASMKRFVKNFPRLPESVSSRLTLENDDKASMYSVKDLYYGIYKQCGVPIVFDYHHHRFCDGGMSEREALEMAISTWPKDITLLYTTARVAVPNNLTNQLDPKPILIMCTITLIIMVMTLML